MARPRKDPVKEQLIAELSETLPRLDSEGLAFLLGQARVHLHNMEVIRQEEELAKELEAGEGTKKAGAGRAGKAAPGAGKAGTDRKKAGGKAARDPDKTADTSDFRIEKSPSGASYHIVSGGKWKMFSEAEMLAMVKIAQSKDPIAEVSARLWNWIDAERPDAFEELDIGGERDPRVRELVSIFRKKFAVRKA